MLQLMLAAAVEAERRERIRQAEHLGYLVADRRIRTRPPRLRRRWLPRRPSRPATPVAAPATP